MQLVVSGPRVKLVSCKSALNPAVVYSSDRSKAVVPVLVLLFVALWFILRGDLFYVLTLCYFVLVFFSPFSIAITSLGEERANLSAFRTFIRFVLVWFYRFPLPLGVWKGLRFVIVALPGLFSYLFFFFYSILYICKIIKIFHVVFELLVKIYVSYTVGLFSCLPLFRHLIHAAAVRVYTAAVSMAVYGSRRAFRLFFFRK